MRTIWLAGGLAAGYVLGTRAGREKYEQLAAAAREVRANPTVPVLQTQVKRLISGETTPSAVGSHARV
jgi:hypothetical protein